MISIQERNADPNITDANGLSPLHWACYAGNMEMIAYLIVKGAHVNAVDSNGTPPIFAAVRHGHTRAILALLHAHANLNTVDKLGHTSLMLAASNGHEEAVRLLLVYGANPSMIDPEGLTAHDHARARRQLRVLDMLLQSSLNRDNARHLRRCNSLPSMCNALALQQNDYDSQESWEGHQQQLYHRANKEIICDLFVRLDDFKNKNNR